ncbi:MAG: hypothetical protein JWO81_2312, partial [Alphaproteobacteria bacterium]|nr:hypothetical protein [Alphaproteobacteria bacterium]
MGLHGALVSGLLGEVDFGLGPLLEVITFFVRHFTLRYSTRYAASITNGPAPPFLKLSLISISAPAKRLSGSAGRRTAE